MLSLILTCLLAFCATLVGMPSLIAVAKRKHLVDEPTEARKIHHRSVPTVGGLMVFAALMSSSLVSFAIQQPESNHLYVWVGILGAAMLVFFMGLKDDIVVMSASRKLFVHMAVGAYLVGALDLRIDNFGGLFGLGHIPFWASAPFSWFVYIVVVNAVNLIDGLDGLIGGFGTIVMTAFGVWFFQTGDLASAIVAFSTAGALLGFLVFNFNPALIFMGDGGSLLLGLIVYAMAIRVMQTPAEVALDGLVQPVAAMCMLAYPLVDTLRVFTLRVLDGRSPFSPDRWHIHHKLMELGLGHKKSSGAIWLYTLFFVFLAYLPNSVWFGLDATGQFVVLLGLAFGIGTSPALLVRAKSQAPANPAKPKPTRRRGSWAA
ncbi:MAG: MraY family glycosyltransferase [Bacteroidota bacterium]|nr:MraY family glycosyltransferase [Bacteroidota bacterium]